MNNSNYTPGPWTVTNSVTKDEDVTGGYFGTFNIYGDGKWLADTKPYATDGFTGYDQAEANACLMKAAPDMFEAIKEFVDRCEQGSIRSKKTYAKFKAILLKATTI